MDIEEIYHISELAEEVQPFLATEAQRYENFLGYYNRTENHSCEFSGFAGSERFMEHEAAYFDKTIEFHEEILADLRDAADDLPECQEYRFVDGEKMHKDRIYRKLDRLIEEYDEIFDDVLRVCSIAKQEDITGPLEIRSKRNQREARREFENQDRSWNLRNVTSFFAD